MMNGADRRESGQRVKEFQHMVTSDQIVGRPRTECAVASILTEPATAPVNWYTSVIVHIFIFNVSKRIGIAPIATIRHGEKRSASSPFNDLFLGYRFTSQG